MRYFVDSKQYGFGRINKTEKRRNINVVVQRVWVAHLILIVLCKRKQKLCRYKKTYVEWWEIRIEWLAYGNLHVITVLQYSGDGKRATCVQCIIRTQYAQHTNKSRLFLAFHHRLYIFILLVMFTFLQTLYAIYIVVAVIC